MNTIIPNLSTFYRTELIKKTNELAKALKKEVDNSIEFFSQHYIEKHEDLAAKYDLFFSIGYINLNKILAYVEILSVKDENQSNKFIYEDCYTNCIGVTKAVNSFHELQTSEVSAKFNRLIEYSKIITNKSDLSIIADEHIEIIENHIQKQNVDIYNHYINQYVLSLVKISVILNKLNEY